MSVIRDQLTAECKRPSGVSSCLLRVLTSKAFAALKLIWLTARGHTHMSWVQRPTGLGPAHCGEHEGAMSGSWWLICWRCTTRRKPQPGLTSSLGPLAGDWVDVTK